MAINRILPASLALLAVLALARPGVYAATDPSPKHLMFVSYLGRSHMMPYLEVLQPLAERGHQVTIVTDVHAAPWLRPHYPGFNVTLVPDEILEYMHRMMPKVWPLIIDPDQSSAGFAMMVEYMTVPTYKIITPFLRGMLEADRPDLLLCDFMVEPCGDLAHTLNIRYGVTVSGIVPGVSPAPYVVDWFSPYFAPTSESLTLWQRLHLHYVIARKHRNKMAAPVAALTAVREQFGIRVPQGPPDVVHANALKLINTFLGFETPRPIDPTVQLIGPIRNHANSSLPADISSWISSLPTANAAAAAAANPAAAGSSDSYDNGGNKRVVYAAFGTHVDLPDAILQGIYSALVQTLDAGEADGVIWAVSRIKRDRFPEQVDQRILLLPFAPQKAVLEHPAVKLFISHGGAESSHESMFAGKPVLVVPFFGDQPMNAAKLRNAGMAEFLHHSQVTATNIRVLLHKMLHPETSRSYHAAAARMQALVRTLNRHNTAAAADMLEFFAEHGWDHLLPASSRLPWYKATNADLRAVAAAAAVLALGAVVLVVAAARHAVLRLVLAARSSSSSETAAPVEEEFAGGKAATGHRSHLLDWGDESHDTAGTAAGKQENIGTSSCTEGSKLASDQSAGIPASLNQQAC